jgi:thiamine-phosphate diphosphorylase
MLVVNDRLDIARACSSDGVQLGSRSFSPVEARPLLDSRVAIGRSVHALDETVHARDEGADFVLAGTVFESSTHPGLPGRGTAWLREIVSVGSPVVAIGGIQPRNVAAVLNSGAVAIAVVSGVWSAADPVRALAMYLSELELS